MDLVHTIVTVQGDKVVRLLCRTCKKEHAFRPSSQPKASSTRRRAAGGTPRLKARSSVAEWEDTMERLRGLPAKPYALDGLFDAGEKVEHPVLGPGIVKKLIEPDKMEVLFKEEIKILARGCP